jgi:hypothetical protein
LFLAISMKSNPLDGNYNYSSFIAFSKIVIIYWLFSLILLVEIITFDSDY